MCALIFGKLIILSILLEVEDATGMWLESAHYPGRKWPPRKINGTQTPDPYSESPDFRMEDNEVRVWKENYFKEDYRPYRLSPFYKQYKRWSSAFNRISKEDIFSLGCYCTTVYRKYTLLAGCAVLTTRHILTTASSTELVLSRFRHENTVAGILGAWYDTNKDSFNSSLYMTPCRIHYHPKFSYPHQANISHPLPFLYDVSIWAATHPFLGSTFSFTKVITCQRGGPHAWQIWPSTPRKGELAQIIGYQYVKSQRKIPMPWFKYVVRTKDHVRVCPKSEWHWYHCVRGREWSKYGVDSGAAWHRQILGIHWLYDGLIGMCAFSMNLRSEGMMHYFTVINTHPVLEFISNAYMGTQNYEFLDHRFQNTKWKAPRPKPWARIYHNYDFGYEHYYGVKPLPYY